MRRRRAKYIHEPKLIFNKPLKKNLKRLESDVEILIYK